VVENRLAIKGQAHEGHGSLFPFPDGKGSPTPQSNMGVGEKRLKSRCYGRIFPEPLLI
jgi:hypothetical protein